MMSALVAPAMAQQKEKPGSGPPRTYPPDQEYGTHAFGARLPGDEPVRAAVDRRDEVDPFGYQGAILPGAHVPAKGTLVYSNHLFFGHGLHYVPHPRLMLAGLFTFSPRTLGFSAGIDQDMFAGLTARVLLHRSRNLSVSMQAGALGRIGRLDQDTRELGGRLDVLVDYLAGDNLVLTGGLEGYVPIVYGYQQVNAEACVDREDFFDGGCIVNEQITRNFTPGGRFLMGHVGLTYYAPKSFNFKVEAFSGVSGGTVLDLEGGIYNQDSVEEQVARQLGDEGLTVGPTKYAPLGINVGTGWSRNGFGIQLSMMLLPPLNPPQDGSLDRYGFSAVSPWVLPMSTIGYAF